MYAAGFPPRRRKSAAERREQHLRAQARATQNLLRQLASLNHRGNAVSKLAASIAQHCTRQAEQANEMPEPMTHGGIAQVPDAADHRRHHHADMAADNDLQGNLDDGQCAEQRSSPVLTVSNYGGGNGLDTWNS